MPLYLRGVNTNSGAPLPVSSEIRVWQAACCSFKGSRIRVEIANGADQTLTYCFVHCDAVKNVMKKVNRANTM